MLSDLLIRLRALFRRNAIESELDQELRFHFEQQVEKYVQSGLPLPEARRRARLIFGGSDQIKEECRDARGVRFLEALAQDIRFALRMLRKSPGFTAVAVLTLALGIGANTAIFSLLYTLAFRNLPVPHPGQLVRFGAHVGDDPYVALSVPMFEEFARSQKAFSGVFAWAPEGVFNIEIKGTLSRADIWPVTGNYYSELGATPEIGRLIGPEDVDLHATAATPLAVLGYSFWQRRYGADPGVIGNMVKIEGIPFTIIGVTRKGFGGISAEDLPEVTVPLTAEPLIEGDPDVQKHLQRGNALGIEAAGRLKAGVTMEQARADLETLWPSIREAVMPASLSAAERLRYLSLHLKVESGARGASYLRHRFSQPLYLLLGIAGVVLLVACVNLASLTLARAASRSHEIGVRVALGASRARLVRQMLTESIMLSLAGTLAGLAFANWGSRALAAFIIGQIYIVPATLHLAPDLRILGFAIAAALLTGILFGLAPAWRATREDPNAALQQASRTLGSGTGALGKGLIVTQVALSLVLLAGAGLFIRTLQKLRAVDPGFRTRSVLSIDLMPKPGGYKNLEWVSYYRELTDRVSSLPGVISAGHINRHPGDGMEWTEEVRIRGTNTEDFRADLGMVMPGAFRTMGIELHRGRDFNWEDDDHAPRVAVVSRGLADQFFPHTGAIGQHIDITTRPKWQNIEIVGIVSDASLYDIRKHAPPTVYLPTTQYGDYMGWSDVLVQTSIPPAAMAASVSREIESLGHEYVTSVTTISENINRSLLQERVTAFLSGFFGGLALLLAAIGLYGLMAFNVTRRTREIGIRIALGAERNSVQWLVLRETLALAALGLAVGLPCALAASRLIAGALYGVPAKDPVTLAAVSALLVGVAALAGWFPARRATRIDPMVALRHE